MGLGPGHAGRRIPDLPLFPAQENRNPGKLQKESGTSEPQKLLLTH